MLHNLRTILHLVSGIDPNRDYLVTYNDGYTSVKDYLTRSHMAENGVWANYGVQILRCVFLHIC